jgi:hypothetical protein
LYLNNKKTKRTRKSQAEKLISYIVYKLTVEKKTSNNVSERKQSLKTINVMLFQIFYTTSNRYNL